MEDRAAGFGGGGLDPAAMQCGDAAGDLQDQRDASSARLLSRSFPCMPRSSTKLAEARMPSRGARNSRGDHGQKIPLFMGGKLFALEGCLQLPGPLAHILPRQLPGAKGQMHPRPGQTGTDRPVSKPRNRRIANMQPDQQRHGQKGQRSGPESGSPD